jgi:hypothetical protein
MRGDTNKGNDKHHINITQVNNAAATEWNIIWVFKHLFYKYYIINLLKPSGNFTHQQF